MPNDQSTNQGIHSFSGVYPILYAFFDERGDIDEQAMRLQTERCIEAGAHGITVLGLVTEANKLSLSERHIIMEVVGDAIAGRVPFAVTIGDSDVNGQRTFIRAAQAAGADWVILQLPQITGLPELELMRFLGAVMDTSTLPVGIQNNPINMAVSLSSSALVELHKHHSNFTLLKGEGAALSVQRLIEATQGSLSVFAGQGGIEFMTNLRSGCAGLIPAPDCIAHQVSIYELWQQGTEESRALAEQLYRETLPLIVLMMRNLDAYMLPLGKRWVAKYLGLQVHDRIPSIPPSEFGLLETELLAMGMEPFERKCKMSA
jgi:4-hydroxy-tetrahydrodipicolinate synthase